MVDAETASDFKTGTTLSIIAKAEAFYNMGTTFFLTNFPFLFEAFPSPVYQDSSRWPWSTSIEP